MLAALVGVQVSGALLLRGGWDLWGQTAALLLFLAGTGAWLAAGALSGSLRIPPLAAVGWAAVLAGISWVSAVLSPVAVYSLPSWAAFAAALWLVPAAAMLSESERVRVEQAMRASAWVLVLLALIQRWQAEPHPGSLLVNANVFAGAILLLLPIAARRGDFFLAAGLLLCLCWSRSVGAWLGLSAALVLSRRAAGSFAAGLGLLIGLAALIAAGFKLGLPETAHRWSWWEAAWRMSKSAPWLGLGPGSYAYAFPAYVVSRPELATLFAHQHFLETAAERGWPYALIWLAGLILILRRAEPGRFFGPLAVLVQGLVDYPLSIPGVFALFCVSLGFCLTPSANFIRIPPRAARVALAAGFLFSAACGAVWAANNWRADRLRAKAMAGLGRDADLEKAERLLADSETIRPHPEAARLRAEILLARARGREAPPLIARAARELERAVAMDPYRVSNRTLLEDVRQRLARAR